MSDPLLPTRTASEKSRGVATALAAILGPFGAHRFYLGRPQSGALMLLTRVQQEIRQLLEPPALRD